MIDRETSMYKESRGSCKRIKERDRGAAGMWLL